MRHLARASRHRNRALGAAIAIALVAAGLTTPARSAAANPTTAFFIGGWTNVTRPGLTAFIGDDGTVTGYVDRPEHLYVEIVGPNNAIYGLTILAPVGKTIGVGTWTTGVNAQVSFTTNQINDCSQIPAPSSVTIDEYAVSNGLVTQLAASISAGCESNPPIGVAHGMVRINSARPFDGMRITPADRTWAQPHNFGAVGVGTVTEAWTATVENAGTGPLAVGASITGSDAFTLDPGSCSGSLAPGATCQIGARFAPADPGAKTAALHLLTPGLALGDRSWTMTGMATAPTSLSLVVDASSLSEAVPGAAHYTLTVSPANASGWYEIALDCAVGQSGAYLGTTDTWLHTPPGTCTASASFTSPSGWLPSTAPPVTFTMPTRSRVDVWTSTADGYLPGAPVTVHADVGPGNGATPTTGTVTLVDETTGLTLGSGPITAANASLTATRDDFAAGTHHFVATYSGGGGIVGSTGSMDREIIADDYPPVMQFNVEPYTNDPLIWVRTAAYDLPVNVVTTVRLSNDGVHWAEMPWSPLQDDWSIVDPATGGFDADGTHTVYASCRDRAGNWSPVLSLDVVLDRGLPVASTATTSIATGASLISESLPVSLGWTGSDALSGIDHYVLQRSVDAGPWSTAVSTVVGTSRRLGVAGAHTYRYRAVAVDRAGNATTGGDGAPFHVTSISDSSATVSYKGRWHVESAKKFVGNRAHYSTAAGATASFKVRGRGFAWIGSMGPTRGAARIYIDGVYVKTVHARARKAANQRLLFTKAWATTATHRVTVKVTGSGSRARIDLDNVFVWTR